MRTPFQSILATSTLVLISIAATSQALGQVSGLGTNLPVQVLKVFALDSEDLIYPNTPLVLGSDAFLYGTTLYGAEGNGGIFKLRTDGSAYPVLHSSFSASAPSGCGLYPSGRFLEASDGSLYGTTRSISTFGDSREQQIVVFRMGKDGKGYTVLHVFGYSSWGGLIEGTDVDRYGTTMGGGACRAGVVFTLPGIRPYWSERCFELTCLTFK